MTEPTNRERLEIQIKAALAAAQLLDAMTSFFSKWPDYSMLREEMAESVASLSRIAAGEKQSEAR